ncbi:MAG: ABC transporter ATP-binding protein, partial [Thermoprotei archaeon]
MAGACVEVRGLWVAYRGSPWVLRGVDLEVGCRELVVIASRSGGGKTTLLRVLAGLIPWFYPARLRGRVRVMGVDPTAVRPEEVAAVVGFVRQNPYTQLVAPTVFDEVLGVLLNTGMDPVDARRRAREVLERFGLWRYR